MKQNISGESNSSVPQISVIVPCYNVGKLLQPLLQSLTIQNCDKFEVIFVNDGSSDDTAAVVRQFCEEGCKSAPGRYKLIDKENGGVGSARNAGLDVATGDYIYFVDADDYIFSQTLSRLASLLEEGADVAVGAFTDWDYNLRRFPHITDWDEWLCATFTSGGLTLVNKMFRRQVIESRHIRFDTNVCKSEDHLFTAQYMLHCNHRIAVTDYVVYFYTFNPMSISHKTSTTGVFSPRIADSIYVAVRIYNLLKDSLSPKTLRMLRYDTYHKYRRIRHEGHRQKCTDAGFYSGMYTEMHSIMPVWEMAYFAVRRRLSIFGQSLSRKWRKFRSKFGAKQ